VIENQENRIRIKDIAERAKVSVGTVDRVIHERGEVAEGTRKQVLSIIEELGYTPNILAKSLASKKQYQLAALIPDYRIDNPYWQMPGLGIEKAFEEIKNFNASVNIFTFDLNQESTFIKTFKKLLKSEPDGIVFSPLFYDSSLDFIKKCDKKNIPYIFIDVNIAGCNSQAYFGQNTSQSGYLAAKLMDYGIHEKSEILILKLANEEGVTHHLKTRENGFLEYHSNSEMKNKISITSLEIPLNSDKKIEYKLREIFTKKKNIRGVFVTNSRVYKVAKYLDENNIKNVLLAGYDLIDKNIEYLENGIIDFLIGQKPEEQGYKSIQAMFNYLFFNREVDKVNYSPIDIIMKENIDYYKNFKF